MLPAYANIVTCPHCGGEKELLSLMSGNTFSGSQWWDLRTDYPMLPHVSWVQKCPHCGKYFMLETAKSREGEDYSFEKGKLTYPEIREAWAQLKDSLDEKVKISLMLEYVWAYNDVYQRDSFERETSAPTPEATEEFRGVIRELVAVFPVETKLIHAEYLREAGLFDEAMAIVDAEGEPEQPVYKILAETIRQKCGHKDTSVGLVRYE